MIQPASVPDWHGPARALMRSRQITCKLIIAQNQHGIIGQANQIPWHIPADLKFFKESTMGGVLLMGRKTWQSIGKALPGRSTIVISSAATNPAGIAPTEKANFQMAASPLGAMQNLEPGQVVWICGGATIYAACFDLATSLYITLVDKPLITQGVRFNAFERTRSADYALQETRQLSPEAEVRIYQRRNWN
ncbi:MAG: dihydrofolate reductase [Leptospiraceae bacterium]|nr:dihydrofolate reductase [Leptospiraceae bacterium]